MNKEPTAEQIKVFWEWVELEHNWVNYKGCSRCPAHTYIQVCTPPIDLNNLFKYAAPKVFELGYRVKMESICESSFQFVVSKLDESIYHYGHEIDPALALFRALDEVREASK